MINKIAKTSLAAVSVLGIFAAFHIASAAELVKLEGKVSVNRGDGFGPATLGMALKPGDQVLVGNESAASLVYAEPGCVFEVPEASVVTVSDVGPCIPGQTTALGESAFVTPTATTGTGDADPDLTPFYVMGGGAIVAATAIIINESSKNGSGGGGGGGFQQRPPGSVSNP